MSLSAVRSSGTRKSDSASTISARPSSDDKEYSRKRSSTPPMRIDWRSHRRDEAQRALVDPRLSVRIQGGASEKPGGETLVIFGIGGRKRRKGGVQGHADGFS